MNKKGRRPACLPVEVLEREGQVGRGLFEETHLLRPDDVIVACAKEERPNY